MQYIKHGLLLVAAIVGQSCVTSSNTFWVSGIKTPCSMGMVQTQCLNVHRAEDLHQPEWENFYAPIEGFEFEAGYLQKIKVKETHLPKDQIAADGSSIRYTLVKVLEKRQDTRAALGEQALHDIWNAVSINGKLIDAALTQRPQMEINLTDMRVFGNDGCNQYAGEITKVNDRQIEFGDLMTTLMLCEDTDTADAYSQAISQVALYKLDGLNLSLMDKNQQVVLTFLKGD